MKMETDGFVGNLCLAFSAWFLFIALMNNGSHLGIFAAIVMKQPGAVIAGVAPILSAGIFLMVAYRYLSRRLLHKFYLIDSESYVGKSFESIYATATEQTAMGDQREGR